MNRKKADIDYFVLALFAVSFFSRIFYLGSLPGLHGDEAYFGLNTIKILSGDLILNGMNSYTGPLFDYLRVPIFIFSKSVFALRFLSVLFNSLGPVWLYLILIKFNKKRSSFIVSLLFSFMPWFFLSSRIAWEVMFFPSLILFCIYLFTCKRYWISLSGLICAFGLWTHAIFASATVPIFILGLALSKSKKSIDFVKSASYFALGFAIGLVPKILQMTRFESTVKINSWDQTITFFKASLNFLPQVLGGDILYLRQVGDIKTPFSTPLLILLGVAVLLSLLALLRRPKNILIPLVILVMFILSTLTVSSAVSWITFRYLLIPLSFLSLFFAIILAQSLDLYPKYSVVAGAIILVSIFSIFTNFFLSEKNTTIKKFSYGTIEDTNAHFVDSFTLYKCLTNSKIKTKIIAKPLIARSLEFYDATKGKIDILEIDNISSTPSGVMYIGYADEVIPQGFNKTTLDCNLNNFIVLQH